MTITASTPLVWVLLGAHEGDNNQALALAEALGVSFTAIRLEYNALRKIPPARLGATLLSVKRESRRQLVSPWPDLIIGIGRRSVPVSRWIRKQSGGRSKIVRLGNPKCDPSLFDLVVTTAQYPVRRANNVVRLPLAISRRQPPSRPDERAFLAGLARPHLLFAVGGTTGYWQLPEELVVDALHRLNDRAEKQGGTVVAVTSPRTQPSLRDRLAAVCRDPGHCRIVDGSMPRFPVLLADADEIFVTADSVSMLSEAIAAGKPVGMVPVEMTKRGRRRLDDRTRGRERRRDLRRFWSSLEEQGLVGTIETPVKAKVGDPLQTAVTAVRTLLGEGGPQSVQGSESVFGWQSEVQPDRVRLRQAFKEMPAA